MDCKWVSLTNDRGMGMVASTENSFNFSASFYEEKDLDDAKHTCDLKKRDYIVLMWIISKMRWDLIPVDSGSWINIVQKMKHLLLISG